MRSVMKHRFSENPRADIPRSSLDRSHGLKTTFDAGLLIPVLIDEVLPGDTFRCRMNAFARLATPIHPIMDNIFLDSHFFFVPTRLVWDNWDKFNGAQDDPGDSTDYTVPTRNVTPGDNTIYDYFGLPVGKNMDVNALPFRCYNLIWNEWYRDQNLQDSLTVVTADTGDQAVSYALQRRGKRHDYFTAALPWPQKGDSVDLPLGTVAPVTSTGDGQPTFDVSGATDNVLRANSSDADRLTYDDAGTFNGPLVWNDPKLEADLSGATAASINQLRQAFQIQKLLERDARGGTRYTEIVRSHFGVTSPDARLQRPEYLGGGSTMVNISPVPQTSESNTTAQGNLAAFGTANLSSHGFTYSSTEHGYIIGLVSARADLTYQQGIERFWSRETRYDFYWPALAHIGEQAILNKEIFAQGSGADDNVFGYIPRYDEYRYKPSRITGKFRSDASGSLDPWHLSIDFASLPALNASFIQDNPPIDRAIAVPAEPHFLFDAYFTYICARPMPVYGVPGLIDHF